MLTDPRNGESLIIIETPTLDQQKRFVGALLGGVYLRDADLGAAVKKLTTGDHGFAYLVDSQGRVIFHPDASKKSESARSDCVALIFSSDVLGE